MQWLFIVGTPQILHYKQLPYERILINTKGNLSKVSRHHYFLRDRLEKVHYLLSYDLIKKLVT